MSKVPGPVGNVFTWMWVGCAVIDAFRAEKRRSHRQDFVYGVMWQALDELNHIPAFVDLRFDKRSELQRKGEADQWHLYVPKITEWIEEEISKPIEE